MIKIISILIFTMLVTVLSSQAQDNSDQQQKGTQYVKVEVNGLACPFCAYGLEKKLKKVEGAKELQVFLQEGYALFQVPADKVPSEEKLKKIVADAGFEARAIKFSDEPFDQPVSQKNEE